MESTLMIFRQLSKVICLAVCLSLSNSVLLLGQLGAWSNMTKERVDDRGIAQALISSLEGEDLCKVCLVVREENRKQSESGTLKESPGMAKLLVMSDDCEWLEALRPVGGYAGILERGTDVFVGRSEEVAKPPPRIEV
ncbi:hypothetical protein [Pelagicoccus sp. SDUM812002]|uniref:hypothetical protein n=1 Tax=Pelagicoccus sp. SDUM812002 TaxID=3041266 RepID=UPI00280EF655|nr:hypothetical protein [Pelagicoccus sp. SDUM812002]MDQ8186624.1 hypothetical protein [Pelagicoccus sp. SDUM812002]